MVSADNQYQNESEVRSYSRVFDAIFKRASGTEIWDETGRRYLDFLAGAGSLNYGHNHPVLKKKLLAYISSDDITHSLDLQTTARVDFLQTFQKTILAPRNLDYVVQFTGPTGTNAVDAALKLARKVTGRTNIISFTNGFHGVSVGVLSATGNKHHRGGAGLPLGGVTIMPFDGYLGEGVNSVAYLDKLLSDPSSGMDKPAAVILETVQGEGGINVASKDWLIDLQALCHSHEILLIVDDIQAGCGRTGTFFSFEEAGLKPDIVTLSKSLSGYGLPFAVTLFRRELDIWKPGEHNGTFRGNNHAFVTASESIHHFWSNFEFSQTVKVKGAYLGKRLAQIKDDFPDMIEDSRGRGMMRGLKFKKPDDAAQIAKIAFQNGLIIERAGPNDEVIKFLMPLTIPQSFLDEGIDIVEYAIRKHMGLVRARTAAA